MVSTLLGCCCCCCTAGSLGEGGACLAAAWPAGTPPTVIPRGAYCIIVAAEGARGPGTTPWLGPGLREVVGHVPCGTSDITGVNLFIGSKVLCACFVLKFALQRGEGEKRKGVQVSKQNAQNL